MQLCNILNSFLRVVNKLVWLAAHGSLCNMLQQLPDITEEPVLAKQLMLEGIRLLSLWDLTPLIWPDHPDHQVIEVSSI